MRFALNLNDVRSIPKLHLFDSIKLGTAATHASFLQAVWEGFCFATPRATKLSLYGEYHVAHAHGGYLKLDETPLSSIPKDYEGYSGLLDWLYAQSRMQPRDAPNPLLPFEGFALIIYLTEWCIADISTHEEHFRQTFYQGQAVIPCERRKGDDRPKDAPFIQLQYLLAPPQFHSRLVTPEQIRLAFSSLRRYNVIPSNLRLTGLKVTEDGFEARIKPTLKPHA
jgi:hypothetical protein